MKSDCLIDFFLLPTTWQPEAQHKHAFVAPYACLNIPWEGAPDLAISRYCPLKGRTVSEMLSKICTYFVDFKHQCLTCVCYEQDRLFMLRCACCAIIGGDGKTNLAARILFIITWVSQSLLQIERHRTGDTLSARCRILRLSSR